MLTRRFTIVCLICTIFAMVLSDVVVSAPRAAHLQGNAFSRHCLGDVTVRCQLRPGR